MIGLKMIDGGLGLSGGSCSGGEGEKGGREGAEETIIKLSETHALE